MSFSLSSTAIECRSDGVLVARCVSRSGAQQLSEIALNDHIGNKEGRFDVGGRDFSFTARDVRLEGDVALCADLRSSDGHWHQDSINLDALIENDDGRLVCIADFDPSILRPPDLVQQARRTAATPRRIEEPAPALIPVQCHLCDDWLQRREGQGRVSRIPQITVAKLASDIRRKYCPTCMLVERIIQEFVPNLVKPAKAIQDSIIVGVHPDHSQSPGMPNFDVKYTLSSGEKFERSCVMHTRQGDQNVSELYRRVPPARLLSGSSTSRKSISMTKRWLERCISNHDKCRDSRNGLLPARILDIGTRFADGVKLKTAREGERATYACFSHCWGQTQALTLTKENYVELQRDIPWGCLQKAYTDVITLCRLLKIRYIWIDALCIVQNSPDDWKSESAKMHMYYGGCYVCIAATSAADHDGGCSVRNFTMKHHGMDDQGKPYCVYLRPNIPHIMRDHLYPHWRFFPLLTRAWVYQERRLSPRVLHVTDMELFFECNTGSECECGECGDVSIFNTSSWTKDQEAYFANHHDVSKAEDGVFKAEHQWRSFVRAYSKLSITKETDRLPALSGLAQMSRSNKDGHGIISGRYLAGCWEGSLINDIAWAIGPELRRLVRNGSSFQFPQMPFIPNSHRGPQRCKPAEYIAPSWSWASVMDGVEYAPFGYSNNLCQIHGADVELEDGDPYGQVKSGFLLVRAQLLKTQWKWQKTWRGRYAWLSDIPTRQFWGLKKTKGFKWWRDWKDGGTHVLDEAEEVYLMPLATRPVLGKTEDAEFNFKLNPGLTVTEMVYLVLRQVNIMTDPAVYERVGWALHSGMSGGPDMKKTAYTVLKLI